MRRGLVQRPMSSVEPGALQLGGDGRCAVRILEQARLADGFAAGLELRLDEQDAVGARLRKIERRRQGKLQRNERHVRYNEGNGMAVEMFLLQHPCIQPLDVGDARIGVQARMESTMADVNRNHMRRAVVQQDFGKATRRGADVETSPAPPARA